MSKTKRSLINGNGHSNGNGAVQIHTNRIDGLFKTKSQNSINELHLKKIVSHKTLNQKNYIKTIQTSDITFCTGPAGSGKTHLAVGVAAMYLAHGKIDRIIIARPTVSCEEELGFLPGALDQKIGPYLRPIFDELLEFFSVEQITYLTNGKYPYIEGVPLGMMKGRTFKKSFIILDEAQDASYKQIKTFLTRMGEDSKIVVTGDSTQSDRYDKYSETPLEIIMDKLYDAQGIGFSRLDPGDIQRHPRIEMLLERL